MTHSSESVSDWLILVLKAIGLGCCIWLIMSGATADWQEELNHGLIAVCVLAGSTILSVVIFTGYLFFTRRKV